MTQRHWMTLEGDDYLDQLFVWHVDDLLACCLQNEELHPFTRLRMAHTLRILTLNGKGNHLAFRVQKRRQSELIVLIAEAHGDEEPEIIPSEILRYFERGGPGCLNSFSASMSGASAGVRLPSGEAAG